MPMRAQTMAHVGNNSVIRILSSVDLSRYVANAHAVAKVQPHLLAAAAHPRRVNVRINTNISVA